MNDVNIPLLRKAVEWVEEQAKLPQKTRQWYQESYIVPEKIRTSHLYHEHGCGTAYCVAGYVGQLLDERYQNDDTPPRLPAVSAFARDALGITTVESQMLFAGSNTAKDVRRIAESIAGGPL